MSASKLCEATVKHEYHKNCVQVISLTPPQKVPKVDKPAKSPLEGRQTVKYFSPDGMKTMVVPSKEKTYYPITVGAEELERLKAKAVVVTEKERLKMIEIAKAEQTRLETESEIRKNELKQYDKRGKGGTTKRLSGLEREARDKANYLLQRAWDLKNEEEDEVKKANSLILQAKCQAIRDAQLAEHKLIQRELKAEEKRVEQMVDDERCRLLLDEKKRREAEKMKKENYVKELQEQMDEIQARRLLEEEQIMEERRRMNEAMFLVMLDELEQVKKREEEKRKTREALNQANEQIKRAQEIERQEDRMCDLKMQEYMRMRAEREEKFENEKLAEKKRKEIEMAKQRTLQEKAADLQAVENEINAVRRQEEYEREWRRKEREEVMKKIKTAEELRLAREEQIKNNRKYHAIEIARDKRDFERNLQIQLEQQERERLLDVQRKHQAEVYREQILKQINTKEKERIAERQEKFHEGVALRAEEVKRKNDMKQILAKKIEIIRQNRVPEIYIAEIQRHLDLL